MKTATEVPTSGVSHTMPTANDIANDLSGQSAWSETPRFGWYRETGPDIFSCKYRLIAEDPVERSDPSERNVNDAIHDYPNIWMVFSEPHATEDDGTGYLLHNHLLPQGLEGFSIWQGIKYRMPSTIAALRVGDLSKTARFSEICAVYLEDLACRLTQQSTELILAKALETFLSLKLGRDELHSVPDPALPSSFDESERSHPDAAASIIEQPTHVNAIHWLEEHAGLSQEAVGHLVGVSRQTVRNWLKGDAIRDENRQRLLAVRNILERVQQTHQSSDALKTWLDTPRGAQGRTPRQLLIANEIGKARALSLSTTSPRSRSAPEWLRGTSADTWTLRQRRRRDNVLRNEPTPDPDGTEIGESLDLD